LILLLDIGNTCLHLGLARKPGAVVWHRTIPTGARRFRVPSITTLNRQDRITGVAICSVVPELTSVFKTLSREQLGLKPLVLDWRTPTGLKLNYRPRSSLGPDRIANALAACHLYRSNALVVDMGTATTIEAVTRQGEFLGGAILPGLGLMLDALACRTARLPGLLPGKPHAVLGQNTRESILSGAFHAHFAGISRIIQGIEHETKLEFRVIATGGLSRRFGRFIDNVSSINPLLTLQGLSIAFHSDSNRPFRVLTRPDKRSAWKEKGK